MLSVAGHNAHNVCVLNYRRCFGGRASALILMLSCLRPRDISGDVSDCTVSSR
jgi:hypothetical protein